MVEEKWYQATWVIASLFLLFLFFVIRLALAYLRRNDWASSDHEKAVRAAKRTCNEKQLEIIVKSAKIPGARMVAAKKMTNPVILADVAKHDTERLVREYAVNNKHLTDQKTFEYVAMHGNDQVVYAAIQRLTDPSALANVAQNHPDSFIQGKARDRIKVVISALQSPDKLMDIARNSIDPFAREQAVKNTYFDDQSVLCELAQKDSSERVRAEAAAKITDEKTLAAIVKNDNHWLVRSEAIKKLHDPDAIDYVAIHDTQDCVRMAAVKKVTNKDILEQIMKHDKDATIRGIAEEKVTGACVLHHLEFIESERTVGNSGHTLQRARCQRCGKIVDVPGYKDNW